MTYEQFVAELTRIQATEPDVHTAVTLYYEHVLRVVGTEQFNAFLDRRVKERAQQ